MKPGTRLISGACDTEVVVVRGGDLGTQVECGGLPMSEGAQATRQQPVPGLDTGTQLGKRYSDPGSGIEILCVKPGQGTLAVAGVPLEVVATKQLPSSD